MRAKGAMRGGSGSGGRGALGERMVTSGLGGSATGRTRLPVASSTSVRPSDHRSAFELYGWPAWVPGHIRHQGPGHVTQ